MREKIARKLCEIERAESVRIIAAVESGSRAWGFASPDSDYDVRFLYVRREEDYLRLDPLRDVIEWQLDDVYDISGWDIQKALRLLQRSNPTLHEWCVSPIVYRDSAEFDGIRALAGDYLSPRKCLGHYLHMAENNHRGYFQGEQVKLKRYFYVLRPLLAARWVLKRGTQPPMRFDQLMEAELDPALRPAVDDLLERKRNAAETEVIPCIPELNDFLRAGLEETRAALASAPDRQGDWEALNRCFLHLVRGEMP